MISSFAQRASRRELRADIRDGSILRMTSEEIGNHYWTHGYAILRAPLYDRDRVARLLAICDRVLGQ